jgi:hypothetical protein
VLASIPADASVQVPFPLMAHLAERDWIRKPVPPEMGTDVVVLDAWHRRRWAHREDLLRTVEEPLVRAWLARGDHGVIVAAGDFLALRRGADPRGGAVERYITGRADPEVGTPLCRCLALAGARTHAGRLELDLVAREPCPSDLAIRIGSGERPRRVDLLFDGVLSPAHVQRGDRLRSMHAADEADRRAFADGALRIGALRSSGARPEHEDPISVAVGPGAP